MTRVAIGGLSYEGTCSDAANARYDTERVRRAVAPAVPDRDVDAAVHLALTLLDRGVLALADGDEPDRADADEPRLAVAEGHAVEDPRTAAVEQVATLDPAPVEGADEIAARQGMLRLHAVLVGIFEAATGDTGPSE